jgi:hypothetical protein
MSVHVCDSLRAPSPGYLATAEPEKNSSKNALRLWFLVNGFLSAEKLPAPDSDA